MATKRLTHASTNVRYGLSQTAHTEWMGIVRALAARPEVVDVCDVGGGAAPLLCTDDIEKLGLSYTVLDISEAELAKAPAGYRTVQQDVSSTSFEPDRGYDLVLSRFVAEHMPRPDVFHRNVLRLLRPDGHATHYFPTLYAAPFVANRLLPEALTATVLERVHPWRKPEGTQRKFPAYYRWCRGPSRRQIARFDASGFDVEDYAGFFGSGGYSPIPALERLDDRLSRLLVRRPVWWYTSYAFVVLRRPNA